MSWEPPFDLGPGSAELPEGRRFLRMLQRNLRYILGGAAVVTVAVLFLGSGPRLNDNPIVRPASPIVPTSSSIIRDESSGYVPETGETHVPASGTPLPEASIATTKSDGREIYAITLSDLPGLTPDSAPGTRVNLWVTWEPPVTRRPKVQLLLEGVTLERISPPLTVNGPFVANLLVSRKGLPDLLWADRFGKLNASTQRS
ncbi:MAG TPA: hypothetical protein VE174_05185 [Actinomycetota bacterium]|nr:hypothetical protein [Actinomycetota bacterium]